MGRIIEMKQSRDGFCRAVTVELPNKRRLVRPTRLLYPIEDTSASVRFLSWEPANEDEQPADEDERVIPQGSEGPEVQDQTDDHHREPSVRFFSRESDHDQEDDFEGFSDHEVDEARLRLGMLPDLDDM